MLPEDEEIPCLLKQLPDGDVLAAAELAIVENPLNAPVFEFSKSATEAVSLPPTPQELAFLTGKYWKNRGRVLTVGWLDNPNAATRRMILEHANLWSKYGDFKFVETNTDPMVRISRVPNDGYWSYLGTDILSIPRQQATMNLANFTEMTSAAEYMRIVPHEFGHTCGMPHEHLRPEFVANIDPEKAIAYFRRTAGWNAQMVYSNVLTPLDVRSILGTSIADPISVMTYPLPGSIMKDGRPLPGGSQISPNDARFFGEVYPLPSMPTDPTNPTGPVNPPPPPPGMSPVSVGLSLDYQRKEILIVVPTGWQLRS